MQQVTVELPSTIRETSLALCAGGLFYKADPVTGTSAQSSGGVTLDGSYRVPVLANSQTAWFVGRPDLNDYIVAMDITTNTVSVYAPSVAFPVPPGIRFGRFWRARMVLSDGDILYFSAIGDFFSDRSWNFSLEDPAAAYASSVGQGMVLTGGQQIDVMPMNDDLMLIGMDSAIWIVRGDPRSGGGIFPVTEQIGLLAYGAWCQDPQGAIWLLASDGLIYRVTQSGQMTPVTMRDPAYFFGVSRATHWVSMVYDVQHKCVRVQCDLMEEPDVPLAAPTNLSAADSGPTSLFLSWTDNSNREAGFKIYRKEGAGAFTQIATVAANITSYTNGGLTSGTTYTYRVRAFRGVKYSQYSNEASGTPVTPSGFAIGMNLAFNSDGQTAAPWINLKNLFRRWGSAATPWDVIPPAAGLSAAGYPKSDAGSIAAFADVAAGTYNWTIQGSGVITWSGTTATGQGTQAGTVQISDGNKWFKITGINSGNPPHDLKIIKATTDINTTAIFNPVFLASLVKFSPLRFMQWGQTNSSPVTTWTSRTPATGLQTYNTGVAPEYQIALCNQAGKDAWICIPALATDDYVDGLAALWAATFTSGNVYIEISNEVWNFSIGTQANQILAQGQANADLLPGITDFYGIMYQQVAWKLRKAVIAFRTAFGGSSRVRGVLAGQAAQVRWVNNGAAYLEAKYGAGSTANYVYCFSCADYFNPTDYSTVDLGFSTMATNIATVMKARLVAHKAAAVTYGVNRLVTYEGGWGALKPGSAVKLEMQTDSRMGDAYEQAINQAFNDVGVDGWLHYYHVAPWVGGEYWGAKEHYGVTTPKWEKLIELG